MCMQASPPATCANMRQHAQGTIFITNLTTEGGASLLGATWVALLPKPAYQEGGVSRSQQLAASETHEKGKEKNLCCKRIGGRLGEELPQKSNSKQEQKIRAHSDLDSFSFEKQQRQTDICGRFRSCPAPA